MFGQVPGAHCNWLDSKTVKIYSGVKSVKLLLVSSIENSKINNYTYGSQVYRTRLKWT